MADALGLRLVWLAARVYQYLYLVVKGSMRVDQQARTVGAAWMVWDCTFEGSLTHFSPVVQPSGLLGLLGTETSQRRPSSPPPGPRATLLQPPHCRRRGRPELHADSRPGQPADQPD